MGFKQTILNIAQVRLQARYKAPKEKPSRTRNLRVLF